jgi:hypothetical protein
MSRVLTVCLSLASTPALAAQFPVTAAYGTPSACVALAELGMQAIVNGDDLNAVLITPTDIAAAGLTCQSDNAKVNGANVVAACIATPDQPFTLTATIEEDARKGVVKYIAGRATVTLKRCD